MKIPTIRCYRAGSQGADPLPLCFLEISEHMPVALERPPTASDMSVIYFVTIQQTGGFTKWGREKEKMSSPVAKFYQSQFSFFSGGKKMT